ncbi:hypothetical protein F2Q68_00009353 [Brassica cretica]|uniref:Uncharacterized protein n=1 Tax=Brassica cretica TaxID=69181 RepID=A0A3N6Q8K6_BRACR|nr:hypothetical protein F2Q68_00009353 [Brassica cretica]
MHNRRCLEQRSTYAGLAWNFSGSSLGSLIQESWVQTSLDHLYNRKGASLAADPFDGSITHFSDLKVFSNNQMLVRAISDNNQSKEIIGIVKDIRLISSEFASISIAHISRSLSSDADRIAKDTLQVSVSL